MPYYLKKDFRLIGFEKSKTANKKYDAVLENKSTKRQIRVPFGDNRFENFRDKTGLNLYPKLIHNDKKRRELYRMRHAKDIREGYYSPGYFALTKLW